MVPALPPAESPPGVAVAGRRPFLAMLATVLREAEEIRGDALRAANVRAVASRRSPGDEGPAAIELKVVGALFRAGQDREPLARAMAPPSS